MIFHKKFLLFAATISVFAVAGYAFISSFAPHTTQAAGGCGGSGTVNVYDVSVIAGGTAYTYPDSSFTSAFYSLESETFSYKNSTGPVSVSVDPSGEIAIEGTSVGTGTYQVTDDMETAQGDCFVNSNVANVTVEPYATTTIWDSPNPNVQPVFPDAWSTLVSSGQDYILQAGGASTGIGGYSGTSAQSGQYAVPSGYVICGVHSTGLNGAGQLMANEPIACPIDAGASASGFSWSQTGSYHVDDDVTNANIERHVFCTEGKDGYGNDNGSNNGTVSSLGIMDGVYAWGSSSQLDQPNCGIINGSSIILAPIGLQPTSYGAAATGYTMLVPDTVGGNYFCPTDSIVVGGMYNSGKNDSVGQMGCAQVRFPQGSVVTAPPGTITVNNVNSVTGAAVTDATPLWSFNGADNPCAAGACSGSSVTYANQTPGSYTILPSEYLDDPLYSYNPSSVNTGSLLSGSNLTFTNIWDPLAGLSVSPASLALNASNGYTGTVTITNTGPSGAVLEGLTSSASPSESWLTLPAFGGASIASHASQNFTVTASPDPSCTGGGCSTTVNFNGISKTGSAPPLPSISIPVTLTTPAAPTVTITSQPSPSTIVLGQSSTFGWSSTGATSCTASNDGAPSVFSGALSGTSGNPSVTPTFPSGTWDFTVTCTGPGGSAAATTGYVNVIAPTVSISASPATIILGQSTNLTWSSTGMTSCSASNDGTPSVFSGSVGTSGNPSVTPTFPSGTWDFTVTCTGPGGSAAATTGYVNVIAPTTVSMSAASPSTVVVGSSATLNWTSGGNPTSCAASANPGEGDWSAGVGGSGPATVTPSGTGTHTYTITCSGPGGTSAPSSATVTVIPPTTATISASPTSVTLGQSSTLTWSSSGSPTSCTASGDWSGGVAYSGSTSVTPSGTGTHTYTITCSGPGGSAANSASVIVGLPSPPTAAISASPTSVHLGQSASLMWSSVGATSCAASGAWSGSVGTGGTQSVTPPTAGTSTYTVTCSNIGGSSPPESASVAAYAAPTATLSASPASVTLGSPITLAWSSAGATSCSAAASPAVGDWSGALPGTSGSRQSTPSSTGTYSYSVTCTGPGGSVTAVANSLTGGVVTVTPPLGTIVVNSVNSQTDQPINATWSFAGSVADPCSTGTCTGASETYTSQPTGSYIVSPISANDPSGLYEIDNVLPASNQSIVSNGDVAVFTIEWDPIAVMSAPSSLALSPATPDGTVSIENIGAPGSTLNNITVSIPASASGWLSGPASLPGTVPSGGSTSLSLNSNPSGCALPQCSTTVTVNGTSLPGASSPEPSVSITVTVSPTPPSVNFPDPSLAPISLGDSVTLGWSNTNVNTCTAAGGAWSGNWSGAAAANGSAVVTPSSVGSNDYTISCTGYGGTVQKTATVQVNDILTINPSIPVTASIGQIENFAASGGVAPYTWTYSGPANATPTSASSSQAFYSAAGTYTVTLQDNAGHSVSDEIIITAPTCSFVANPASVVPPEQSTLQWSCANAISCTINNSEVQSELNGSSLSGNETEAPNQNSIYTLSCSGGGSGPGADFVATTTVTVNAPGIHEINP